MTGPASKSAPLRGVIPMLPTPFGADGEIVRDDIARLTAFELEHGVDGIAILGLGGEASALTVDERLAVCDDAAEAIAGRVPLVVGIGADSRETASLLARHAASRGAAAVMAAPPANTRWDRSALRDYYLAICDAAAPSGVMVQDAPIYLGVSLGPDFVLDLAAARANVTCVKTETLPCGAAIAELASRVGDRLSIFAGNSALHYIDALDAGAIGIIPGSEMPDKYVAIDARYRAGDRSGAYDAFRRILPLIVFQIQTLENFIASSKAILHARGVLSTPQVRIGRTLDSWSRRALARHVWDALELDLG
jgi:dihydrodipicolinate synthase/N-acetylneuraminate lyase